MEAVLLFDKPAQAACVASADKMGTHLPKLPRGVVYGDSAFVKVTKPSDDKEEELAVPTGEVHKACAEAAALNDKTAAGKQANRAPIPRIAIQRDRQVDSSDDDASTINTSSVALGAKAKQAKAVRLLLVHGNITDEGKPLPCPYGFALVKT